MLNLRDVVLETDSALGILSGEAPELITLGMPTFDRAIGGMSPGTTALLGADTGVGKTWLACWCAMARADAGHKTAIISCEDPPDVLGSRFISYLSGVSTMDMRRGSINGDQVGKLHQAATSLENNRHIITSFPPATLDRVIEETHEACRAGARLVVLDYIQCISAKGAFTRKTEVENVLRGFRDVLKEHRCAGLALSQMRKKDDPDRVYNRFDYYESNQLIQIARMGMVADLDREDPDKIRIRLLKSTHGGDNLTQTFVRSRAGTLVAV